MSTPDKKSPIEISAASDDSILQVHAKLQSQKPEKADGYSATPLVLLGIATRHDCTLDIAAPC